MQTIPAAIKTLLKSKSMIGPNAPSATIGTGTGDPVITATYPVTGLSTTAGIGGGSGGAAYQKYEASIARKANGKLIVVFIVALAGSDITTNLPVHESEVEDVMDLVAAPYACATSVPTGISLYRCGRVCVFNVGSDLFLVCYQLGASGSAGANWGKIYKSPSGNGGDWALYSTVYSATITYDVGGWGNGPAGPATAAPPTVLPSGRWVMCGPQVYTERYTKYHIWTSDDAGITWTLRYTKAGGVGTGFAGPTSRRVVRTRDGLLWSSYMLQYGSTDWRLCVLCSTDDGNTWSVAWETTHQLKMYGGTFYPDASTSGLYLFSTYLDAIYRKTMYVHFFPTPAIDGSFTEVCSYGTDSQNSYSYRTLPVAFGNKLVILSGVGATVEEIAFSSLPAELVEINREQAAAAQRALVFLPNVNPADFTDPGYYSPDRGDDVPADKNDWYHILYPGSEVEIEMGYGADMVRVFKGQIDDVTLEAKGATYRAILDIRDDAWNIIDKTLMDGTAYKITYKGKTVEYMAEDLLKKAGITAGDITTETTGITIAEKVFERMSYADALAWCQTVSGFELLCDDNGLWSFHYPTDRQPEAVDEALVLTGTDWTNLANPYAVLYSDIVRSAAAGGGTLYSRSLDYEIEYGSPARIRRRAGSAIPNGATVYATYVYAAWSFEQGVDIFELPYLISRRDIYGTIVVYGEGSTGNVIDASFTYAGSTAYGVSADKVLFVEIPELDSWAKCWAAANQLGHDMMTKVREVNFAAIGNPWIQVGDCIRVHESATTISEIYRVAALSHVLDATGFITQFTAYHYGYTPL